MKSFFLHPTVKKICYIVGLLTIAGWLLSGLGRGLYHGADYMGWIPEHAKHHEWHRQGQKESWRKSHPSEGE